MDLNQTSTIAGIKIKVVRDAIREMARHNTSDTGWPANGLADHMNISPTHAEWLSDILVDRQVLERKPPASWDRAPVPQIRYALGEYGTRFMLARMLKRIDRAKVEKIVADLLTRVKQINADPNLCYFVNEIRLFGSAADLSADSFGDVDIAYDLGQRTRPPEYKEWFDWSRARSDLAGRSNLDFEQKLNFAEKEVLGLLKHRNQYLSLHSIDDVVGIGAKSKRLFIVSEGEVDSDDGLVGEKLHQLSMKRASERAERKKAKKSEPPVELAQSLERTKQSMISALQSLAFDLIRVIEEGSPLEALEQTIRVAHQRIEEFRKLNEPDDLAAIFCESLSIDLCEKRSKPIRFVFSEDRERMELDGTFKEKEARKKMIHAVLKAVKSRIGSSRNIHASETEIERAFRLKQEANYDGYEYRRTHSIDDTWRIGHLSDTAILTLSRIANGESEGLHKQALKTLADYALIKPFRKKWRLTPKGEKAIKYHSEKDAFYGTAAR